MEYIILVNPIPSIPSWSNLTLTGLPEGGVGTINITGMSHTTTGAPPFPPRPPDHYPRPNPTHPPSRPPRPAPTGPGRLPGEWRKVLGLTTTTSMTGTPAQHRRPAPPSPPSRCSPALSRSAACPWRSSLSGWWCWLPRCPPPWCNKAKTWRQPLPCDQSEWRNMVSHISVCVHITPLHTSKCTRLPCYIELVPRMWNYDGGIFVNKFWFVKCVVLTLIWLDTLPA